MNVSNISASAGRPAARSVGTSGGVAAADTSSASSAKIETDFLKYATMSPMERMRANILKSMNLTEDQVASLPQQERTKVEDQIKETIKKMISDNGQKGQAINILA